MRAPVSVCPTCRSRTDESAAGKRCDTWGCPGRYETTLFPEAVAGVGPVPDAEQNWTHGRHPNDHYLFDVAEYAGAGEE